MSGKSVVITLQDGRAMSNAALVSVIVADAYKVSPEKVLNARHTADCLEAQQVCMYICVVELRSTKRAVARAFGCSNGKVRLAVTKVEDRRDDPVFDQMLDALVNKVCPVEGGAPLKYA